MKRYLIPINLIMLTAGFSLRAILPLTLFLPCFVFMILLPQMILLWFKTGEVIEAYEAYKKAKVQEKVLSVCRKKNHYDPVFCIANRQTIFRKRKITPVRAVRQCGQ